jgi:hypothetical protein
MPSPLGLKARIDVAERGLANVAVSALTKI